MSDNPIYALNEYGIPDYVLQEILQTISNYESITCAQIFGSRAKGNYKRYSDIDIAIFANTEKSLASDLKFDLEEIYMIYEVDVLHFEHTSNEEIKQHINRTGKTIFSR